MENTTAARSLFEAWARQFEGMLTLEGPGLEARLGVKGDKVVHVEGIPDLLGAVLPEGSTGDLTQDIGLAMSRGIMPEQALREAAIALGCAIVRAGDASLREEPGVEVPRGAFPMPLTIPRMLTVGFERERPAGKIAAELQGQLLYICSSHRRRSLPGLDPVSARVLRVANQSTTSLGDLIAELGGDPRREAKAWVAVDMMLQLGLMELDEPPETRTMARQRQVSERLRASTDEDTINQAREEHERERAERERERAAQSGLSIAARIAELRRKAREVTAANPLEALEIDIDHPQGVNADRVREAFRRQANTYHPDRFISESQPVQDAAAEVFDALRMASEALQDPTDLETALERARAEREGRHYVSEMDQTKARVFFRKANALTQSRRWAEARDLVQQALDCDPNPQEYVALRIVCDAFTRQLAPRDAVNALDELELKRGRWVAQKEYDAGRILKQANQIDEAMARFRRALDINPNLREAEREVRLYERRNTSAQPSPSAPQSAPRSPGLGNRFSGLFGKKNS